MALDLSRVWQLRTRLSSSNRRPRLKAMQAPLVRLQAQCWPQEGATIP